APTTCWRWKTKTRARMARAGSITTRRTRPAGQEAKMSLRKLPEAKAPPRPKNFQWDAPSDVLAKWADRPHAAEADEPNTISIYDVIGEDWWTGGGFTAKRMAAALRSIGKNDVTVNINSPGGDMFEGIAIYNLLREHPAKVTV